MRRAVEAHPCPGCTLTVPGHFLMCGRCFEGLGRTDRERLAAAFTRDTLSLTAAIAGVLRTLTTGRPR